MFDDDQTADVALDGAVSRQRSSPATPRVHEVELDLTDTPSTDHVLDRLVAAVEDLEGTARVRLRGRPAPGVVVHDEDITSWSTERLAIVVDRPAAPAPRAISSMALETIESHLEALRAPRATMDPDLSEEVRRLDAPSTSSGSRGRAVARVVAALVTVSSAVGLLLVGDTVVERGLAIAALAVLVAVGLGARRRPADDARVEAVRARARAALLRGMEHNAEVERARHAAVTALRRAGLPTDPAELAAVVAAASSGSAEESCRHARPTWVHGRTDPVRA